MLSNIEPIARAICAKNLATHCKSASDLAAEVDRYWHCIAALLEGGLLDHEGNTVGPFDLNRELDAYRDYKQRHKLKSVRSQSGPAR
jgi:hypothetical protein